MSQTCHLTDEELDAWRRMLRKQWVPHIRSRAALPDGVAFTFDATPERRRALEDFVAFERGCCPGLRFSQHEQAGALRLEIHGVDPQAKLFTEGGGEGGPLQAGASLATRVVRVGWVRSGRSRSSAAFPSRWPPWREPASPRLWLCWTIRSSWVWARCSSRPVSGPGSGAAPALADPGSRPSTPFRRSASRPSLRWWRPRPSRPRACSPRRSDTRSRSRRAARSACAVPR
jgi:hypothetical protein